MQLEAEADSQIAALQADLQQERAKSASIQSELESASSRADRLQQELVQEQAEMRIVRSLAEGLRQELDRELTQSEQNQVNFSTHTQR